jgi:hypothetical protein
VNEPRGPSVRPVAPYTSTLLHLLGDWLFEAAIIDKPGYAVALCLCATGLISDGGGCRFGEGRAQACAVLCRLFCVRSGPQLPVFLGRFYHVLFLVPLFARGGGGGALAHSGGIRSQGIHDPFCFPAIVLNGATLFALDLAGVYMLLPALLGQFQNVLANQACETGPRPLSLLRLMCCAQSMRPELVALRHACITILGSVLSLANRFGAVRIGEVCACALGRCGAGAHAAHRCPP